MLPDVEFPGACEYESAKRVVDQGSLLRRTGSKSLVTHDDDPAFAGCNWDPGWVKVAWPDR